MSNSEKKLTSEEVNTHKTANTHTSNVFMTCDLWPFDSKIYGFSRTYLGTFLCHVWWC